MFDATIKHDIGDYSYCGEESCCVTMTGEAVPGVMICVPPPAPYVGLVIRIRGMFRDLLRVAARAYRNFFRHDARVCFRSVDISVEVCRMRL